MPHHATASESEALQPPTIEVTARRALWGVAGLVALTVGSLGVAWLLPDATSLHFLWVAQAVPVLYWLLAWWGIQSEPANDDAP